MSILATAPITRRYWPLSQLIRALELQKLQGYKSWSGTLPDKRRGLLREPRYFFKFHTSREAYDEYGGHVGTEVYEALFFCEKKRNTENCPPVAGRIDPDDLEEFSHEVLELLVEPDEMVVKLYDAPMASPSYAQPDRDFIGEYLENILERALINSPTWRWDHQQLYWTLDHKE